MNIGLSNHISIVFLNENDIFWTKFGNSCYSEDGCCDKKTYRPCRSDPQGRRNLWGHGDWSPPILTLFQTGGWGGADYSYQIQGLRQFKKLGGGGK